MTQKVLKVGSSAAVTIPKHSLEELGLEIGDRVYVSIDLLRKRMIVGKNAKSLEDFSQSDRELMRWTQNFIQRYRKELEILARQ